MLGTTALIFAVVMAAAVVWLVMRGDKDEKFTIGANLLVAALTAGICAIRLMGAGM